MIPSIVESLSDLPTRTLDNRAQTVGITPGGLSPAYNMSTLGRMQLGTLTPKLVVAIEGCKYLLSDAPSASVLSAWSGTDHTQVLGGLFVDIQNTQEISPDEPFPKGGKCLIRVIDQDHTDTFGIYLHKRSTGDKTAITSVVDRNDTTLNVASAADFASSGDAFIGPECIGYTGKTATTITGATRGKYAALGCDTTGSGGRRFARHHRVSTDPNTTLSNPAVSEVPRYWIGKFVTVHVHTWDETTSQMNTKANSQIVFSGRIVTITDDPDTMATVLEVEHISQEFKNAIVGKDLWGAEIAHGIQLVEGRRFTFRDYVRVSGSATFLGSTDLVVTTGASGAYEIEPGQYTGDEITAAMSRWLAQALNDSDAYGYYAWNYGVSSNVGPRTQCNWRIANADNLECGWFLTLPGEVAAFLGLSSDEGADLGQQVTISVTGHTANQISTYQGDLAPYSVLVCRPMGPSALLFNLQFAQSYDIENERGAFVDQWSRMPASLKTKAPSGVTSTWGLFLLDEKAYMLGSYDSDAMTLTSCVLVPFKQAGDNEQRSVRYIGRRIDEPQSAVTVRQVLLYEGPFADLFNEFAYSTGTTGYNHGTRDVLPAGVGIAIPGSLLGPRWERSIARLPGAQLPISVMIDEPTKFADIFRDDLRARRAFIRWHDQGFEFGTWRSPMASQAQHTLTDANKAAPVGTDDNHRVASQESDEWHVTTITFDYSRDFGTGRSVNYLSSITLEDQAGTDGSGNLGKSATLKMRNTFPQFAATGAAVEELIKEYLVGVPMFARPGRKMVRSIDLTKFESIGVGDTVVVEDLFARDPLTGARGVNDRAAIVTRVSYNLGGSSPDGNVRPMIGEVELFLCDTHRGGDYSPGAEVDDTANYGGFAAGYNSSTKQLWLKKSTYSINVAVTLPTLNDKGQPDTVTYAIGRDAQAFTVGDKIVVCEIDPSNTASPTYWEDTVAAVSVNQLTMTTGLAGWSSSKKYRVFFDQYTDCTASQKEYAFQADAADEMIQDVEIADNYAATNVPVTYESAASTDQGEFVADLCWGDGKPQDVGTDAALAKTANAFSDYKSAHQQPFLWKEYTTMNLGLLGSFTDARVAYLAGVYHFGDEVLTGTVTRTLTCALWYRATASGSAYVRVTLSRLPPINPPQSIDLLAGVAFPNPEPASETSQSAVLTTSSTTWAMSEDVELNIAVKDLVHGAAWLVVEVGGYAEVRGFAKLYEGPREVT